jgi:hypothetical protein
VLNPVSESHRRLLNHVLNPPISSDPPASLDNWSRRVFKVVTDCVVSEWDMRRLFNHLRLADLALSDQYTVGWTYWRPASRHFRETFGPDTLSVRLMFRNEQDGVMFDVHMFLAPDGEILASGRMDPKGIHFLDAVRIGTGDQ